MVDKGPNQSLPQIEVLGCVRCRFIHCRIMTNVPFTRLQYHSKISAIFQDENKSLYSSCSNLPVQVNTQLTIVEMELFSNEIPLSNSITTIV